MRSQIKCVLARFGAFFAFLPVKFFFWRVSALKFISALKFASVNCIPGGSRKLLVLYARSAAAAADKQLTTFVYTLHANLTCP